MFFYFSELGFSISFKRGFLFPPFGKGEFFVFPSFPHFERKNGKNLEKYSPKYGKIFESSCEFKINFLKLFTFSKNRDIIILAYRIWNYKFDLFCLLLNLLCDTRFLLWKIIR